MSGFSEDLADTLEGKDAVRLLWCDYPGQECETCSRFLEGKCQGHDPDAEVIRLRWPEEMP